MWPFQRYCQSKNRLVDKTVVITGANTGIGKETARDLYRRGARVILACRDLTKANAAVEDIKLNPPSRAKNIEEYKGEPGSLAVQKLDLKSFASVRKCAHELNATESKVHILINNAGVAMCPFEKTEDGFETHFQTNHLDPTIDVYFDDFNLEKSYSPLKAYGQSKLLNVLFAKELDRRLQGSGITGINTYSLHPGIIATELGRHLDNTLFSGARALFRACVTLFMKDSEQGAQTTLYCALDDKAGQQTGLYYKECHETTPGRKALDEEVAARVWKESLRLTGLPLEDNLSRLLEIISKEMAPTSK